MPERPSFLESIDSRVLVCDGAMGTLLYTKGVFVNRCFDELNLTQADLVAEVHQEYARAGADVLETNTFGANAIKLRQFGLDGKLRAINVQGARLARHAARDAAWVAGAVGPLGIRVEPWGRTGLDEAQACFREQVAALLEGGVDLFVLETFQDARELGAAIAAVREVCDLPVVAQMTTDQDGRTLDGAPPEAFVPDIEQAGPDVLGLNCSVGPAAMLDTLDRLRQLTDLPLAAQPNAGRPREIDGRKIYLSSPEYMASYARRFMIGGVSLIGGCCGTTPEHTRAIRAAVRAGVSRSAGAERARTPSGNHRTVPAAVPHGPGSAAVEPVALADRSRLANLLARGTFVVVVELPPPRGERRDDLVAAAQRLKVRGADAVGVPDGLPMGGRMSALAAAVVIEQQAGIETVLHYECRGRVLLRMQSDLLGAHALGLRNLVVVTGDVDPRGLEAAGPAAGDADSIGLTNVVARLNRGLDVAGQPIGSPTAFHIGVAASPDALDLDEELRRYAFKVEAGAEFVVTEPVFDLASFDRWLSRLAPSRIPVIARVRTLESVREAEFLANEVPQTSMPPQLIERLRQAADPPTEGRAIARELAAALRSRVQGLQVEAGSGALAASVRGAEELLAEVR